MRDDICWLFGTTWPQDVLVWHVFQRLGSGCHAVGWAGAIELTGLPTMPLLC